MTLILTPEQLAAHEEMQKQVAEALSIARERLRTGYFDKINEQESTEEQQQQALQKMVAFIEEMQTIIDDIDKKLAGGNNDK